MQGIEASKLCGRFARKHTNYKAWPVLMNTAYSMNAHSS